MTRPSIVRADTIDLQDHDAPSAKDHHRQPRSAGAHQAETLREVAHESAEEQSRSPRLSWNDPDQQPQQQDDLAAGVSSRMAQQQQQQQQQEDPLAVAQNGGVSSSDEGDMDGDDLDDDMMDRISSSPSIEDGAYQEPPQTPWPPRSSSLPLHLRVGRRPGSAGSSPEHLDTPEHTPLQQLQSSHHLLPGEYGESDDGDDERNDGSVDNDNDDDESWLYEDIDFEFVYALHTFVATVEGQANATKGDTMVLLDDSNSYWWLVRVVKDSSIGYLPAEHIETPTERLARLNKHRNVDLSQSMLGDQAAKSKKSFNSIRKRWKSVTFSEPTYVDHPGADYSTDEEDIEELFGQDIVIQRDDLQQQQQQQQQQPQEQHSTQQNGVETEITDEGANVEPLKTKPPKEATEEPANEEVFEDGEGRSSEDILDGRAEGQSRSRNGTLRNTDSFFKDDSVETKKISLTPNLLRDDGAPRPSSDSTASKDTKSRPSLDSKMDKELVADKDSKKKSKEKEKDKKEKDKKPSAIRSFFSRKDKRRTSEDDDGESFGKRSMDVVSESRDSEDPAADEAQSPDKTPSRSPSKLQKQQPRTEPSPTRKTSGGAQKMPPQADIAAQFAEHRTNDVSNVPPASMRIVDPDTQETREVSSNQQQTSPREESGVGALAKSLLPRTGSSGDTIKPQKTVKAKERMELDESDSSEAEEAILQSAAPQQPPAEDRSVDEKPSRPQLPGAFPDSYQTAATVSTVASEQTITGGPQQDRERLSESPVEVSPVSPVSPAHASQPPGLTADSPTPEDSPSPDLGQGDATPKDDKEAQPTWDDTKLRAFFDGGDHVRDLLAVVYDTSDAEPTNDHPMVNGLFREQNAKLAEITTQLDNMLGDWLARKQRSRGTL